MRSGGAQGRSPVPRGRPIMPRHQFLLAEASLLLMLQSIAIPLYIHLQFVFIIVYSSQLYHKSETCDCNFERCRFRRRLLFRWHEERYPLSAMAVQRLLSNGESTSMLSDRCTRDSLILTDRFATVVIVTLIHAHMFVMTAIKALDFEAN